MRRATARKPRLYWVLLYLVQSAMLGLVIVILVAAHGA